MAVRSEVVRNEAVRHEAGGAPAPSRKDGDASRNEARDHLKKGKKDKNDAKTKAKAQAKAKAKNAIKSDGSCWPGAPGTDPRLCPPNDPEYARRWDVLSAIPSEVDVKKMHPSEAALGAIGFSLDKAWQRTTGRDDVVLAVLDSGIIWENKDLVRKVFLNAGELPFPQGSFRDDANRDGIFNIDDFTDDPRVGDRNGNGLLDPGDLIQAFSDCRDDDGNGYPDDIAGYDFFGAGGRCGLVGADSDPTDETRFGHGTGIATSAAAETNNGIADAGVCPRCRVLPVRIGDSFVVDGNQFARGVLFAVRAGATVVGSAVGSYNNTPAARRAIEIAYERNVPVIASAADEFSYHHNYPAANEHALYVNAIRYNHTNDWKKATTFWGVNPCTNFGARVSLTVPATSCSSGATARMTGMAGLIESAARDAGVRDLGAEEVYQILRSTADDLDTSSPDWSAVHYRAKSGFDQLYGYGRLNAARAVEAAAQKALPPSVELSGGPRWFAIVSPGQTPVVPVGGRVRLPRGGTASWRLEYALGVEPRENDYRLVAEGTAANAIHDVAGQLDFRTLPVPAGPPPRDRSERDRYSVTLRLRATDGRGMTGEARRSFFVLDDPAWKPGFPIDLGASGEAGPLLVDLDGDGRDEIVLPAADGVLRIVSWRAENGAPLVRTILLDRSGKSEPAGEPALEPGSASLPESAVRSAVVGDITGRGEKAIVVATREGKVYAFTANGDRLPGFPVAIDPSGAAGASPSWKIETGILSTPVLADLDGTPGLEIVVSGLDARIHVWKGDGSALDGFPVTIEDPATEARGGAKKRASGTSAGAAGGPGGVNDGANDGANARTIREKIVSTPAVGDLDGDGRPEIVVGSNRVHEGAGGVYALRAEGTRHPAGPFLPGWKPFEIIAVNPDLLPTVAHGVPMGPVLIDADGDGDQEVVAYAVTGTAILLIDHDRASGQPRIAARYLMTPSASSPLTGLTFFGGTGSPLVADTDHDGSPELYASLLPLRILTLRMKPGVPLDVPLAVGGWTIGEKPGRRLEVPMLSGYPRRMEDLMLMSRPAAADVDGDGADEVLMGSGGYLLHAFRNGGGEADSFPKFTGGWIFSPPAAGDLDGDGLLDLVTVTREGFLFAWSTGASPGGAGRRDGAAQRSAAAGGSSTGRSELMAGGAAVP